MKLNRICRSATAVLLFFPFVTGANTGSCGGSVTVGSGASSEAGSSGGSAGPGGPVLQDAGPEPGDALQGTPPDDATASSLGPCDPLAPPPVALGAVIGVGQGPDGTLYVVDRLSPGSSGRVFVSSGNTLYRQDVEGSGQRGATDYNFEFADPSAYGHLPADGGGSQSLLLQVQGGTATAMQVGPPSGKGFLGDPGIVGTPLTVLPPSSVAGMKLQNLPGVVGHVADVADGNAVVVTQPMDDYSTMNLRLFYGPPKAMVERSILQVQQSFSGNTDITFLVGSSEYTVHFSVAFPGDGGLSSMPGPATIDAGDGGTIAATERWPVPTALNGFMFDCFGVQAGVCMPVLASDYDQTCAVDTDCLPVGQIATCPPRRMRWVRYAGRQHLGRCGLYEGVHSGFRCAPRVRLVPLPERKWPRDLLQRQMPECFLRAADNRHVAGLHRGGRAMRLFRKHDVLRHGAARLMLVRRRDLLREIALETYLPTGRPEAEPYSSGRPCTLQTC